MKGLVMAISVALTLLLAAGLMMLPLPAGKESNWIKTDPSKGFFVVFRFYGPLEGYIDKTWGLNDFEPIR